MCSFLYFMVLFLVIALNRVTANTTDEIHIVPVIKTHSSKEDGIFFFKFWECRAYANALTIPNKMKSSDKNAEQKVFKFNDHLSYYTCVEQYCCFFENGRFYTNFKNYNNKTSEFKVIQTWSTTNYEKFKEQLFTINYEDKSSGFNKPYKFSGLSSVKASTSCSGDQCTWSCEIDSKKALQFQFPKPSTLTSDELKTIKMYRDYEDWFSCSAGFCCNMFELVNFNSMDLKDSNYYDWIESKKSRPYYIKKPTFVTRCSKKTPCTEIMSSTSNKQKSSHGSAKKEDNTKGSTNQGSQGGNQPPPPHVSRSQTNEKDNTVGSTSTNQDLKRSSDSSLTQSKEKKSKEKGFQSQATLILILITIVPIMSLISCGIVFLC